MPVKTTHVGSLPRTPELLAANTQLASGQITEQQFQEILERASAEVVTKQREIGIDIVNEGEYGHQTSGAVDYGAWWNYSFSRLGGLTQTNEDRWADSSVIRSEPGKIRLTTFTDRRDRNLFREAYEDPDSGVLGKRNSVGNPVITAPLTYTGADAARRDVNLLLKGLQANGVDASSGFMAALSPGSCARIKNQYYRSDEEVVWACADAMRQEYKIITDAGLTVQIDDPSIAESWDQINPEPSLEDYKKFIGVRIEALNWALKDIPTELTRFHVCWGSWHGPHTTDIPFADIVEDVLRVDARGYSFEASSPRHAHEWRIWYEYQLPADKVLIPGVVCHSTNVVEHQQLVADRLSRYVAAVGPERVIASTDCGLGGRLHSSIAWAKLQSLVAGAKLV
ncbi:cobalamin-independent methionine synthase II family protein [uncultured Varibaculum sp.]|uniref:cobalamin-independent methionine synthase II family protein n=1 Tax=uncultured Varibaculum sp. TaxID=413896 RepID=UPI002674E3AB|nr:cobalamin-independent methionine synthase II family protein [uncultured Varibaculum sp.]